MKPGDYISSWERYDGPRHFCNDSTGPLAGTEEECPRCTRPRGPSWKVVVVLMDDQRFETVVADGVGGHAGRAQGMASYQADNYLSAGFRKTYANGTWRHWLPHMIKSVTVLPENQ